MYAVTRQSILRGQEFGTGRHTCVHIMRMRMHDAFTLFSLVETIYDGHEQEFGKVNPPTDNLKILRYFYRDTAE